MRAADVNFSINHTENINRSHGLGELTRRTREVRAKDMTLKNTQNREKEKQSEAAGEAVREKNASNHPEGSALAKQRKDASSKDGLTAAHASEGQRGFRRPKQLPNAARR